jgi:hypothetical protein
MPDDHRYKICSSPQPTRAKRFLVDVIAPPRITAHVAITST